MQLRPWSTRISVNWRTTLRFYERRYEIMREIEDQMGVAAYLHQEDLVGARLPGNNCEVELTPSGIVLGARNPEADIEQLISAGTIALKAMEYPRVTGASLRAKHVVPLAGEFGTALHRAIPRLLGTWSHRVEVSDLSLLCDGKWEGRSYQIEFGVAEGRELAHRLPGRWGRLGPEQLDAADRMPNPPPVSLFVESFWPYQLDEAGALPLNLEAFHADTVAAANGVVQVLLETVSEGLTDE